MSEHILIAEENLKQTGESIELGCIFCNKETPHKVGYMGSLCLACGLQMFDFDSCHDVYPSTTNTIHLLSKA